MPPGVYQLVFCLAAADTGTSDNPELQPLLDDADRPLRFSSVSSAMQCRARLCRISGDLIYYAVPAADPDDQAPGRSDT